MLLHRTYNISTWCRIFPPLQFSWTLHRPATRAASAQVRRSSTRSAWSQGCRRSSSSSSSSFPSSSLAQPPSWQTPTLRPSPSATLRRLRLPPAPTPPPPGSPPSGPSIRHRPPPPPHHHHPMLRPGSTIPAAGPPAARPRPPPPGPGYDNYTMSVILCEKKNSHFDTDSLFLLLFADAAVDAAAALAAHAAAAAHSQSHQEGRGGRHCRRSRGGAELLSCGGGGHRGGRGGRGRLPHRLPAAAHQEGGQAEQEGVGAGREQGDEF